MAMERWLLREKALLPARALDYVSYCLSATPVSPTPLCFVYRIFGKVFLESPDRVEEKRCRAGSALNPTLLGVDA
jgi:hypothetical protein